MNVNEYKELIELSQIEEERDLTESEEFRIIELRSKFTIVNLDKRTELINAIVMSEGNEQTNEPRDEKKEEQIKLLKKIADYLVKLNHRPQVKLEKLEKSNWREWKLQMLDGLKYYDLHYFVNCSFGKTVYSEPEFKRYDDLCKSIILMNLCPINRELVLDEDTAQVTFDKLQNRFEGPGVMRMVTAVNHWYSTFGHFESMEKLIHSLREMIRVFNLIKNEDNPDALWCAFFLAALPNSYSHLRTTLSNKDKSDLEDHFISALQEERFKSDKKNSVMIHNMNSSVGRFNGNCYYCQGNHRRSECPKLNFKNSNQNRHQGKGQFNQNSNGEHHGYSNQRRDVFQNRNFNPNRNFQQGNSDNRFNRSIESNRQPQQNNQYNRNNGSSQQQNSSSNSSNHGNAEQNRPQNNSNRATQRNVLGNLAGSTDQTQRTPLNHSINSGLGGRRIFDNSFTNGEEPVIPRSTIFVNSISCPFDVSFLKSKLNNFQTSSIICNSSSSLNLNGSVYYMDTGATDHFLNNQSICYEYFELNNSEHLVTAEGAQVPVDGVGQAYLSSTLNTKLRLRDCIVCTRLKANFISASRLDIDDNIYVVTGNKTVRIVYKDALVMMGFMNSDRLYELHVINETPKMNFTVCLKTNEEKVMLIHRSLAHMPFDKMRKIENELGVKIDMNVRCFECLKSRAKRLPFPVGSIKSTRPLNLIHMDLSGCIRIPNRDRYQYFLVLVDDYSRYKVVVLLQNKTQVFKSICDFKTYFETQLELKLKCFRSDNGTEFANDQMNELCRSNGIMQQFSCPRTPEQNSVAERTIGMIKQTVRALLCSSGVGMSFWSYAVSYAVFILNRIPSTAIGNQIPYELFFNKKVNFDWVRLFGSRVIYTDDAPQNTFSPTGIEGLFLGYPPGVKGYWIYSYLTKKVIVNRNVKFLNYSQSEIVDYDGIQVCRNLSDFSDDLRSIEEDDLDLIQEDNSSLIQTDVADCAEMDNSSLSVTDYGQDNQGLIKLNKSQRKIFEEKYPNVNLRFVRGTNTRGPSKISIYRINHIVSPKSFIQAMKSSESDCWKRATDEEFKSIQDNDTWTLIKRPLNVKVLPLIWLFTTKLDLDGNIERYKARLVVLGNLQPIGRDFNECYAPVVNELTFRIFISISVHLKLFIHQVDVKSAFLHANIVGDVYVEQPVGYKVIGKESYVYKLTKALYGLRQSALQWYRTLNEIMSDLGYKKSSSDPCVFYANFEDGFSLIIVYVDDLLIACGNLELMNKIKKRLANKIEITDKMVVRHFLNLDIEYDYDNQKLFISQSHYIQQLIVDTNMSESNSAKTPVVPDTNVFANSGELLNDIGLYQMILGRLIYLATHSRPDICFIVSRLCAFMHCPTHEHMLMVRRVIRYLKATKHFRLEFSGIRRDVRVYCDADFSNDESTSRSITGLAAFVYGNLVSWYSRKQKRVSNSTCQAEVMAIVEATLESEYIFNLINELDLQLNEIVVFNDNNSARLTIVGNGGDFSKNKHYRTHVHLVKEVVQMGWLRIEHCPTDQMLADYLTKPLPESQFMKLVSGSNLICNSLCFNFGNF